MPREREPARLHSLDTEGLLRRETEELWGEAEAAAIWDGSGEEGAAPALERYGRRMLESGQAALCLSGGGIRSAAFALGVVQALARKGLLAHFQYLSTVSGGGYLGAFLSRWVQEQGLSRVADELAGRDEETTVEPAPIRYLRENSNFLTPRVGINSPDTWTAIAMSVRNIIINWLVFAPALLMLAALPNLGASLLVVADGWFADLCLIAGTLLVALATWSGARHLPSHVGLAGRRTRAFISLTVVLPAAFGAAALTGGIAPGLLAPQQPVAHPLLGIVGFDWFGFLSDSKIVRQTLSLAFLCLCGALLVGYVLAWLTAMRETEPSLGGSNAKAFLRNLPVWLIGVAASGLFYVAGLPLVSLVPCPTEAGFCGRRVDTLATLGVVWGILAQLVVIILFVAFRRVRRDQAATPDLDREWLARLSAQKIRAAVAWTLFATAALLVWHVLSAVLGWAMADPSAAWKRVSAVAAALSGPLAVFGGKARVTGYRPDPGSARKLFTFDVVVAVATLLFIVVLLVVMGRAEFALADWLAGQLPDADSWSLVIGHVAALVLIGLVLSLTSTQINVNRFSLNGMYRNRLARTFLGAGRERREDVDPFTGFAAADNIRLQALRAASPVHGRRVLMPVVNVALNLVGGARLAWQERKAQSFVFTPLACGSAALGEDPATGRAAGRYVATGVYAGNEPELGLPGSGASLATAIAISGAAASPSMGYHSAPATAFLMTLFNVRLGAWLPNPGRDDLPADAMSSSGPKNALLPLLRELAGRTDAQGRAVYLSDGGHFENLGLYEMVRRRCRTILVSDAGCDRRAVFEDLGNAVRKIRIDLGVEIDLDTAQIASRNKWSERSTYFALGKIRYPEGEGELLYIKPSCVAELPSDVRAYSLAHPDFPHEPTSDQWFSESQFESYRSLGAHLVGRLGKDDYASGGLAAFFADLRPQDPED